MNTISRTYATSILAFLLSFSIQAIDDTSATQRSIPSKQETLKQQLLKPTTLAGIVTVLGIGATGLWYKGLLSFFSHTPIISNEELASNIIQDFKHSLQQFNKIDSPTFQDEATVAAKNLTRLRELQLKITPDEWQKLNFDMDKMKHNFTTFTNKVVAEFNLVYDSNTRQFQPQHSK